jgi:thermolysin
MATVPLGGRFFARDTLRSPEVITVDLQGDFTRLAGLVNGVASVGWSDIASDADDVWSDRSVRDAHTLAASGIDFLKGRFGWSGWGRGAAIVNVVHPLDAREPTGSARLLEMYGRGPFYAGGGVIVYGDRVAAAGARPSWQSWSGSTDVVTHEIAHAVIDYSSRLAYRGESGALNEAFADIMAAAAEFAETGRTDYVVGDQPGGVTQPRSLRDPSAFGYPDHYSLRRTGAADNGHVHANSAIASHAFYLAIEGGASPTSSTPVAGVGAAHRELVERAFYRAFVFMLPSHASFRMARAATLQAAADLAQPGVDLERAIGEAWSAVGVF